ncbi:glycerophosphodiester phosphodiesterase [Kosmotoga pacifica]|uniref:GP-PDE domain-containing protein n=1 Tax=Kosmotoga pacifica TaxID=1330330 RepID=A0A0G2Z8S2_9BACT|nr:glycerophosphodiester phosphodiesterase [Kosmotoga pacifica]AKI97957.1 hypothetical protein IX53_09125 [Kosmotoga pacifica]
MFKKFLFASFVLLITSLFAFDVQGHRGCRGLRPENTLEAFKFALEEIGVTTLELDMGLTKDKVPVVIHDRYLNPKKVRKNGKFIKEKVFIKDLTYEELLQYDVGVMRDDYYWPYQVPVPGAKIPKLEDVFQLIKEYMNQTGQKVWLNVETKVSPLAPEETAQPEEFVDALLTLVEKYGLEDHVIVQSFYWKTIMLIKEKNPNIKTAALLSASTLSNPAWLGGLKIWKYGFSVAKLVKATGADIFSPKYTDFNEKVLKEAQQLGLKVVPWTINDPCEMLRFIKLGVDGIITDYPNILKAVLIIETPEMCH